MGYKVVTSSGGRRELHPDAARHEIDSDGRLHLYAADGAFVAVYDMGQWESTGPSEVAKVAERISLTGTMATENHVHVGDSDDSACLAAARAAQTYMGSMPR